MKFREKLKRKREERNMLQIDLAEKLGVNQSTVAKWESGVLSPSLDTVEIIADVLQCKKSELIDDDDC